MIVFNNTIFRFANYVFFNPLFFLLLPFLIYLSFSPSLTEFHSVPLYLFCQSIYFCLTLSPACLSFSFFPRSFASSVSALFLPLPLPIYLSAFFFSFWFLFSLFISYFSSFISFSSLFVPIFFLNLSFWLIWY